MDRSSTPIRHLMDSMLDSVVETTSQLNKLQYATIISDDNENAAVTRATNVFTGNSDNTAINSATPDLDYGFHNQSSERQSSLHVIGTRKERTPSPEIGEAVPTRRARSSSPEIAECCSYSAGGSGGSNGVYREGDSGLGLPDEGEMESDSEKFPYLDRLEKEYLKCTEEYENFSSVYEDGQDEDSDDEERACDRIEVLRNAKEFARERLISYCQRKRVTSRVLDPEITAFRPWKGSDSTIVNAFMTSSINSRLKPSFDECHNMVRKACKSERWGQNNAENEELARKLIHEIHVCVDNIRNIHSSHSFAKLLTELDGQDVQVDPEVECRYESTLEHARTRWDDAKFDVDGGENSEENDWSGLASDHSPTPSASGFSRKPKFSFSNTRSAVTAQSLLMAAVQRDNDLFTPRRVALHPVPSESVPRSFLQASDCRTRKFHIRRRPENQNDTDQGENKQPPPKKRKSSISDTTFENASTLSLITRTTTPFVQVQIPVTVIPMEYARFTVRIKKKLGG